MICRLQFGYDKFCIVCLCIRLPTCWSKRTTHPFSKWWNKQLTHLYHPFSMLTNNLLSNWCLVQWRIMQLFPDWKTMMFQRGQGSTWRIPRQVLLFFYLGPPAQICVEWPLNNYQQRMCSWTLLHCLTGLPSTSAGKGMTSPVAHWWLKKFASLDLWRMPQLVRSTILHAVSTDIRTNIWVVARCAYISSRCCLPMYPLLYLPGLLCCAGVTLQKSLKRWHPKQMACRGTRSEVNHFLYPW